MYIRRLIVWIFLTIMLKIRKHMIDLNEFRSNTTIRKDVKTTPELILNFFERVLELFLNIYNPLKFIALCSAFDDLLYSFFKNDLVKKQTVPVSSPSQIKSNQIVVLVSFRYHSISPRDVLFLLHNKNQR